MEPLIGQKPTSSAYIKDSSTAHFMADVVEASAQIPVIVDFWAPWCGPCRQLTPELEKQVAAANGKVKLVKINIDENQPLAAQLGIQSVPTIYAFYHGQPIDGFTGAQSASFLKDFIARLTGGAAEEPETPPAPVMTPEQLKADTELKEQAKQITTTQNADELQARYNLALTSYANGQPEQAMDELLEIIKRQRNWNEDAARQSFLKILEALGPNDPLTATARRRLSTVLFS